MSGQPIRRTRPYIASAALLLAGVVLTAPVEAQVIPPRPGETPEIPPSLRTVPIPAPNPGLFAADRTALLALGKALFWDMQVGSDGLTACASCHFHAGADHRTKNTMHPGPGQIFQVARPNGGLQAASFPFHRKADPSNRDSAVLFDTDDRAGSAGVSLVKFVPALPGSPASAVDQGVPMADAVYQAGGIGLRQVTGRNSPSVLNAVFNVRNFWDGRASYYFNGTSPFGLYDPNARVVTVDRYGNLKSARQGIPSSSLASQAVGPPLSDVEMSHAGRSWPQLGRKMLKLMPLAQQYVHPTDSVLRTWAKPDKGLSISYMELVQKAFQSTFWDSSKSVVVGPGGSLIFKNGPPAAANEYSLAEYNFSFFFGLAVQAYEATLVSDDTPFDRFRGDAGRLPDPNALTDQQKLGLEIFRGKGRCMSCHRGPEFASGTVSLMNAREELAERMAVATGDVIAYDSGFYNIGNRPTAEDTGLGGTNPFGDPLSLVRLKKLNRVLGFNVKLQVAPGDPDAVDGAAKTPSLRNVELTGPYLRNGGEATLASVIEFYDRGGNFRNPELHADIRPLGLLAPEEDQALHAFLLALTDDRVRHERAPFDHPQIFIPHGHPSVNGQVMVGPNGKAKDYVCEIPAVGAAGGPPLQTFEELLAGIGTGRAHTFDAASCSVR